MCSDQPSQTLRETLRRVTGGDAHLLVGDLWTEYVQGYLHFLQQVTVSILWLLKLELSCWETGVMQLNRAEFHAYQKHEK